MTTQQNRGHEVKKVIVRDNEREQLIKVLENVHPSIIWTHELDELLQRLYGWDN
jgi:TFIIF-interacting CTD phosphatase-like protein